MKDHEQDILAAGAQIVWVLTEDSSFAPSTSLFANAYFRDTIGTSVGLRVGDGETEPAAGVFEDSPFITSGRGFVMIVRKADMKILYGVNYSSADADALADEVTAVLAAE